MEKILVVDDEKNITLIIDKVLTYNGFLVSTCFNGREALELLEFEEFDLIILDIMMPELNGFETAEIIRKKYSTPIIMLSALSEEYDKIKGFELGIDDYLTKPFSNKELTYRVKAILARTFQTTPGSDVLEHKELKIDLLSRIVYVNGSSVKLTLKEYELLVYLLKNKGIALSRDKLLNKVWGIDFYGDERTLDTHIKLLRKNLREASCYISTIRGIGYRFEAE
ncbi:MAG: response regulator transcription factor [Erysipelotrichaceae bacterium]